MAYKQEDLLELAKKDNSIYLILADIGYGEIEPFAESFTERHYSVSVA